MVIKGKTTDWFEPGTDPINEGVYEVRSVHWDQPMFALWKGGQWHMACPSPERASRLPDRSFLIYEIGFGGWRGLAEMPEPASAA